MSITDTDRLVTVAKDWYAMYLHANAGAHAQGIIANGRVKAGQYLGLGTAYAVLAPGDGYSRPLVVHDLLADEAAARSIAADDFGNIELYREQARRCGIAAATGGEALVSVPSLHVSTVLNLYGGYHTPDYLKEKLRVGWEHAVPLAVWLTAFDQEVTYLRGERRS